MPSLGRLDSADLRCNGAPNIGQWGEAAKIGPAHVERAAVLLPDTFVDRVNRVTLWPFRYRHRTWPGRCAIGGTRLLEMAFSCVQFVGDRFGAFSVSDFVVVIDGLFREERGACGSDDL